MYNWNPYEQVPISYPLTNDCRYPIDDMSFDYCLRPHVKEAKGFAIASVWDTQRRNSRGWRGSVTTWSLCMTRKFTALGVPSLKLTANASKNGWLEYDRFLLGWPIFRGELLVSGRVINAFGALRPDKLWKFDCVPSALPTNLVLWVSMWIPSTSIKGSTCGRYRIWNVDPLSPCI